MDSRAGGAARPPSTPPSTVAITANARLPLGPSASLQGLPGALGAATTSPLAAAAATPRIVACGTTVSAVPPSDGMHPAYSSSHSASEPPVLQRRRHHTHVPQPGPTRLQPCPCHRLTVRAAVTADISSSRVTARQSATPQSWDVAPQGSEQLLHICPHPGGGGGVSRAQPPRDGSLQASVALPSVFPCDPRSCLARLSRAGGAV